MRTPGDDAVVARLRAELAPSRWAIVELRPDARRAALPLAELALREGATAAVRAHAARGEVELFVAHEGGGVEETVSVPEGRENERVLALRTTEVLRARGLDLDRAPAATSAEVPALPTRGAPAPGPHDRGVVPPPATLGTARRPADRSVWLEVAPAASLGPGGLPPAVEGALAARADLLGPWSVALFATVPLVPQTLEAPEGRARVSTFVAGAALDGAWLGGRVAALSSGFGAGLSATGMSGEPNAGYQGADDTVLAGMPFVRSAASLVLTPTLRLVARVSAGVTVPRVRVYFGDREAATWGGPVLSASLGLEVALFGLGGTPAPRSSASVSRPDRSR